MSDANGAAYDDYRAVVIWTTYRVRDYGNKKGWVLECELISPFHDFAIADEGDDYRLIREAHGINETFFKCVQAAPRRLQTCPMKAGPTVGVRGGGGGGISWTAGRNLSHIAG